MVQEMNATNKQNLQEPQNEEEQDEAKEDGIKKTKIFCLVSV